MEMEGGTKVERERERERDLLREIPITTNKSAEYQRYA